MIGEKTSRSPRVLVLLATYNGASWLEKQIDSVMKQTHVDVSLLISDDNSSDQTVEIIKKTYFENKKIQLLKNNPGSGSAGQNFMSLFRSCEINDYEYIALCDQDDIWFPGKLDAAIKNIVSSNASAYSCSCLAFWKGGRRKKVVQDPRLRDVDYLFEGAGQGCTFVIKSDIFSRIQLFCRDNEPLTSDFYYHDWLLYLLIRSWGLKWFFDSSPWLEYRQHDRNDTGARNGFFAVKSRVRLICNGWYRSQIEIAYNLCIASGNKSKSLIHFDDINSSPDSLLRRLRFILFILKFSRRKLSDRIVLVISIIMGCI